MFIRRSFRVGRQSICGKLLTVLFELCCVLCLASQIQAQPFDKLKLKNWHQWRGPEASGVSKTATPPIKWGEGKNIQWKVAIDGNGSSTPIIWDNKVFMEASLGEGCSPVVHDGKLVIVRDQQRKSYIEGLAAKTGETRWKADRDEPNAWATPLVLDHRGRTQVITSATNMVRSYDLNDCRIIKFLYCIAEER